MTGLVRSLVNMITIHFMPLCHQPKKRWTLLNLVGSVGMRFQLDIVLPLTRLRINLLLQLMHMSLISKPQQGLSKS